MSYAGYLQDLSQLEDQECLLPISNEDQALTNAQLLELELSRPSDLTSSTTPASILPETAVKPTEAVKANIERKVPFTLITDQEAEVEISENASSPLILTPATVPSPTDNLLPTVNFPSQPTSTRPTNSPIGKSVKKHQEENTISASTHAGLQSPMGTNVSLLADISFSLSPSEEAQSRTLLRPDSRLPFNFDFELPLSARKEAKKLSEENISPTNSTLPSPLRSNACLLVDLKFPSSAEKDTKNQRESTRSESTQATIQPPLGTNASLLFSLKFSPPRRHALNTRKTFSPSNITNTQPPRSHNNESDLLGLVLEKKVEQQVSTMATPTGPVLPKSTPATTLATRTTEDVIAELKEAKANAADVRAKLRLDSYISKHSGISDLPEFTLHAPAKNNVDENDEAEDEDEESEDDVQPTVKPRKITERKRRLNAIADSYLLQRNLKSLKEANKVRPKDDSQQSARWLVNQSENRVIISSPREYQVELFEKAKVRNIIAVLDTGE